MTLVPDKDLTFCGMGVVQNQLPPIRLHVRLAHPTQYAYQKLLMADGQNPVTTSRDGCQEGLIIRTSVDFDFVMVNSL